MRVNTKLFAGLTLTHFASVPCCRNKLVHEYGFNEIPVRMANGGVGRACNEPLCYAVEVSNPLGAYGTNSRQAAALLLSLGLDTSITFGSHSFREPQRGAVPRLVCRTELASPATSQWLGPSCSSCWQSMACGRPVSPTTYVSSCSHELEPPGHGDALGVRAVWTMACVTCVSWPANSFFKTLCCLQTHRLFHCIQH